MSQDAAGPASFSSPHLPPDPVGVEIISLNGHAIQPYIDDLVRLRIEVFRAFPYLYDGDLAYEADYIATYANSADSLFVLAIHRDQQGQPQVVGVATGLPMSDETVEFRRPFDLQGWPSEQIFYFGESVLLPAYRGQGLGVRFFAEREAYARRLGRFRWCAFCAVQRADDHPHRPADYQPLDAFWQHRGYRAYPTLTTEYVWRDIDEAHESPKPMSFWLKELQR
ncbi:GNAT family N-acetyltransferase [Pokkaliibacter sp. MBI-7]|uniref:GNAT family N-acetyltransferase n=1 Tax=Pokkaliibacter sp. MBI-7 TaxID=3040600 RepID=UPI0024470FAA|nr:GNAT family N-acetyltransferase [Pokkaliibacter sp. MBI-7]MDH2433365.1 GNAT family N-acetyltransferase [Pokkaliibacter sp. MBI-7]